MLQENPIVGFVGTGVMGREMAKHLMQEGYKLIIYNRTKAKAEELIQLGAVWKNSVIEIAKEANIIFTMIGYPKDVEEVYFGEQGILNHASIGTYVVDMTTSSPSLAKKISTKAKEKGIYSLDAPVSGGDIGAREASLSIMVGGNNEVYEQLLPLFNVIGKNIRLQGEAGAGQHTKMSNQIAIASGLIGVCEAILYAVNADLDPTLVLKSIEAGAAGSWSLSNLGPRIIANNYTPGFYVKHFLKDMNIALESAKEMSLMTPGLLLAQSLFQQLTEKGEDDSGTQALYKLLAGQI